MFAYSNKGFAFRAWNDPNNLILGEVFFDHEPNDQELDKAFPGYIVQKGKNETNNALQKQIYDLESQQTPRRIREAALGIDNGWLVNLNTQIANLRKQMV